MKPFTLIFSSYNHERFLEAAVRTVYAQTVPFDRIVFFSDGSQDRTLTIARSLMESDPRVIWLQDLEINKGLLPRMIEASERVPDGFIMTLAGDDLLHPDACKTFRGLATSQGFDWAIGATVLTDLNLHPVGLVDPVANHILGEHEQLVPRLLRRDLWIPAGGWCYTVDLLRRAGGYDPRHPVEDYYLGLRLASLTKPLLTSQVISYWRRNEASYSHASSVEMWADTARVTLRFLGRHPLAALEGSSKCFRHACIAALLHDRFLKAMPYFVASFLLWPDPRPWLGYVGRLLKRRLTRRNASSSEKPLV